MTYKTIEAPLLGGEKFEIKTQAFPENFIEVVPSRPANPFPTPEMWGLPTEGYQPRRWNILSPVGVATIKDGLCISNNCIPACGDVYYPDLTWYSGERAVRLSSVAYRVKIKYEGRALILGSHWSAANFGHWLLESVGRLSVLEKASIELNSFDFIVFPKCRVSQEAKRITQLLGLQKDKIISFIPPFKAECFDEMVVPTIPGASSFYEPMLVEFLQKKLNANANWTNNGPLIYIKRISNTRPIQNEAEVESLLSSLGFIILNPKEAGSTEKIASASVVISAHSAGMTPICLCKAGTQVMELVPTSHQYTYYRSIAELAGCNYSAMMVESIGGKMGDGVVSKNEVVVNLENLKHCAKNLIYESKKVK